MLFFYFIFFYKVSAWKYYVELHVRCNSCWANRVFQTGIKKKNLTSDELAPRRSSLKSVVLLLFSALKRKQNIVNA